MKVSDALTRARDILQDAGADYWSAEELPRWLNDARLDAYKLRPDLYESTENVTLVDGARQSLPSGSRWLFEVIRNVSSTSQRLITLVDSKDLVRVRPNWLSMPKSSEIVHYLYDQRDPGHFDVYPPARAGVQIELSYAKLPATVADADELEQEGEYATALVDYVLYRAFLKEADTVPAFHQRAMQHAQIFQAVLSGTVAPKVASGPDQGN